MKNKKLLFYILMILIGNLCSFLISLIQRKDSGMEIYQLIIMPVFGTAFVILTNATESYILKWIKPKRIKDADLFMPTNGMIRFYEKIGIRKWKDKVLELGGQTTSFSKAHIESNSVEYFDRFIEESNYGIAMHFIAMFLGLFLFFIHPFTSFYYNIANAVSITLFNAFLNYLPYVVLRYNMPRLKKARTLIEKINRRKAER